MENFFRETDVSVCWKHTDFTKICILEVVECPQDEYSVQLRMTKRCRDRLKTEKPMGLLTESGLNVAPVDTGGALTSGSGRMHPMVRRTDHDH